MATSGGEGGGIQGITPADSTIVVAGTQTAPTIRARVGKTAGTVAAGDDSRFGRIGDVAITGTASAGLIPVADTASTGHWGTPAGGGDVLGPAAATDGHLAVMDGSSGKKIRDGGPVPATPAAATAAPANLAAAAAVGTSAKYAREDHVHKLPTAAQVGALAVGTTAMDIGGQAAGSYATAAQGARADGAVQAASGIVVERHGANAAAARPAADVVYWIGTVPPTNAAVGDLGYGW